MRRLWVPLAAGSVTLLLVLFAGAAGVGGLTAEPALAAKPPTRTPAPTNTPGPTATTAPPTATPIPQPTATLAPPTSTPIAQPTATPTSGCTVNVSTASGLTTALTNATPGTVICLAAGTYAGRFVGSVSGTASSHIVLTGPSTAILNGGDNTTGYGFHLQASYWELRGFSVTASQKGIVLDTANNNLIDSVTVYTIGDEGIHLRTNSASNTIQNSTVHDTGLLDPGFGEGIYIGSANSNWCTYTNCQPDMSNNNVVQNNHLGPNIKAEPIDIKEGTTGGTISGNYLDATGISGQNSADSWIDVKGNNYTLSGNTGVNPNNNSGANFVDGIQVHVAVSGWGNNNRFSTNNLTVNSSGYGFLVQSGATGNVVCTNNTVTGAASGTANVALTTC